MNRRRPVALPATVLLAIAAVALGAWGYAEADPGLGASDAVYRGVQLLTLDYSGPDGPPWQLELGRYLAAVTLALAVIAVMVTVARDRVERARVRMSARGHHVVVGLGPTGLAVARNLDAGHRPVVAVDVGTGGEGAASANPAKIPVIVGDARDPRTYRDAAVSRAAHVFISLDDDSASLAALDACLAEIGERGPTVHVDIEGHLLWRELRQSALTWGGTGGAVEFVSLPDRVGARMVEEGAAGLGGGCIVVWGAGHKAARTAAYAIRRVLLDGGRVELVLAGPAAEELDAELRRTEPWIAEAADTEVVAEPAGVGPAVAFVVGLPYADALAAGSTLANKLDDASILVEVPRAESAAALRRSGYPLGRVTLVEAEAQALGPTLFEDSARDVIARAKHADYVEQGLARGETPEENPSLRPWEDLSDSLRESNRLFADSIGKRLSDLGGRLVPVAGPVRPASISGAVIEELARVEHERWMDDLQGQGWRYHDGPKDAERRLQPSLVDWEKLDEREREKDRDSIRALPLLLARVGYELRIDTDSTKS